MTDILKIIKTSKKTNVEAFLPVHHNMSDGGAAYRAQAVKGEANMGVEILRVARVSTIVTVVQRHIDTVSCGRRLSIRQEDS